MAEEYYLGNPLLKKANTKIEFTEEQVLEWIKCAQDPAYFARNYIKIVTLDHGLSKFTMYPFQEKMIKTFHNNRFSICKLPRQSGKALSLDTPIPTPSGWTTMGELSVGDKILSPNGSSVSVTMKTETMYNHDCYKIYFDTGEDIVADADHLWEVNSNYWSSGKKVITTKDIFDVYEKKNSNKRGKGVAGSYFIEFTKPIENFSEDNLPIDPYLLGVWLGDGYSSDGRIISHKEDFSIYESKIQVEYKRLDENCIRFKVLDLQKKLKENNLLKNKHIPQVYLRASYQSKLELLRGLMDTDGSLKPNTRSFEFYQKDYNLTTQVVELLSSMGIKSRIRVKTIKGCLYHTVSFTTKERVFNLPRKYNLINNNRPLRPQDERIYIQKIEKVDSVPVACISVDSSDHLFLCGKTFIPTHNSTTVVSYLLHYAIFNDNVNIAILANKASTARDLLDRLQTGYENLPKWLQQGVISWNKGSMELENKSKITAASTSASSIRGGTYNIIFLDEFAFVPNQVADNFFSSVYPVITSGQSSKVIVVSTPYGMNHFYRLWDDSQKGKNEYVPIEVHWTDVPGRDEEFKRTTIANTSEAQWRQEFECLFLGSADTLISGPVLNRLVYDHPKTSSGGLDVYEDPQEEHTYVVTVDVARGVEKDFSAFVVIDVSQFPHKVVAKYRNNQIRPILFPNIIKDVAKSYNNAYVLCEVNDVGDQVAAGLHYDLEYPNLLMSSMRGRAGQILGQGFSGKKVQLGVKMSKTTKKVGCLNLKTLIEDNKLIFNDFEIINELTTFIQKGNSFEAEEGRNDDLVMCIHRTGRVHTEDGIKSIKWIVDNKYTGKVLSLDKTGKFVWSKVVGHSSIPNSNKQWIQIKGKSHNTLTCTTDHKVAFIEDIFNPKISYVESEMMLGKYNVIEPGKRFHKSNPLYNKNQLSAIIGSLLGDSSITKSGKLVCTHSELQKDYSIHKHSVFKGNLRISPPKGRSKTSYCIDALTNAQTHKLRELIYIDGKKSISNIIDFIDEISLAYWYMDDGYLKSNSALLCTDSFSYKDNLLLKDLLKHKFGINSEVQKNIDCRSKKEYFRIFIGKESRDNFFDLISPYIIETMRYKLPEKYKNIEYKEINTICLDYGAEKITQIKPLNKRGWESKLYDITVENTHNFICNGMVVHNCLVMYSWLILQDYFKELTDQDIRKKIYEEQKNQVEQEMSPFGFIVDGISNEETFVDNDGDRWYLDEYGDKQAEFSYMWNYL